MPWSFNTLMHLVERGQFERFDDMVWDESNPSQREGRGRSASGPPQERSRSRARPRSVPSTPSKRSEKRAERPQQEPQEQNGPKTDGERRPKTRPVSSTGEEQERQKRQKEETQKKPRGDDFGKESRGTLFQHPPFQAAQRRSAGGAASSSTASQHLVELLDQGKSYVLEDGAEKCDIFTIEIDVPENKKEIKAFTRDSSTWVSRKLKKGAEMKWQEIPTSRLEDFKRAKDKEVSHWIRESAVRLVEKQVPKERVMKMRWIYTLKSDNSAKARIMIVGYQDPDLGSLHTTSPTMSRRTRGLFLTACSTKGWTALKGDVKAAFLQGLESEQDGEVFARPVRELNEKLGGKPDGVVQILKACYGLANAPAQWYNSVADTMEQCGFERLQSEPCCWRLVDRSERVCRLVGLACAHVDDFLFGGESDDPLWQAALNGIYRAYQWSDWEADTYLHCGVQVIQKPDGSCVLNQSEYSSHIEQIQFSQRHDNCGITAEEKHQLRGVLGALQWKVYQTGPQFGARLSAWQSQLAAPCVSTLKAANKLVRDVYSNRHLAMQYNGLNVSNLEDITFVAWSDAAAGNRRDLSSTGGYLICAAEPHIREGKRSQINFISWKSGRLRRVARSSLSAEIQAFSIAEEELMYVRLQWLEMIGYDIPQHEPASLIRKSPGIVVTDARSLFDIIKKGPVNTSGLGSKEKYSVLDMLSLFQRLKNGQTETRWVHSEAQLADSLTKHVPAGSLIRALQNGTWVLMHDPTFTSSKKLKQRIKTHVPSEDFGACENSCVLEADLPPHVYFIQHFLKK